MRCDLCKISRIESGQARIISRAQRALTHSTSSILSFNMSARSFWLRCETKQFERRAALTPTTAKQLIDAGFDITVERDEQRIFDDAEYEAYVRRLFSKVKAS